jgi:5-methylcytosine-specific restriction enzyme B
MGIYTNAWKTILERAIQRIDPLEGISYNEDATVITTLGDRSSSGYSGRFTVWAGKAEYVRGSSAVFRDLEEAFTSTKKYSAHFTGWLEIRITKPSELTIVYRPITFELLVTRYREQQMPHNLNEEKYKWKLIKRFQEGWNQYMSADMTFAEFFSKVDFNNLVYPTTITVFRHLLKDVPEEFERLLLDLYNEHLPLQDRIYSYQTGFRNLYYSLEGHGANTFQEERTIATLLCFRHPEKYTLFKDSFYSKLSKGLGSKPKPAGQKLVHYYEIVDNFVNHTLKKNVDIIKWKDNLLDDACYKDQNQLILAQDILYKTIDDSNVDDESPSDDDGARPAEEEEFANYNQPKMEHTLNTILYGPPGTGKTYATIEKSVQIANPMFRPTSKNQEEIRAEYRTQYKELCEAGQIEFVTFHQSLSYEDFIEGIKPLKPGEGDVGLKYDVRPGLFKLLADQAAYTPTTATRDFSMSEQEFQKANFYKMSLGSSLEDADEVIYRYCMENNYISLGWGDDINFSGLNEIEIIAKVKNSGLDAYAAQAVNYFEHYIKKGDYVLISSGNRFLRAIGQVTGDYEYKPNSAIRYFHFRKVKWLLKDVYIPVENLYNKKFTQQSIYQLNKAGLKKDFFVKKSTTNKPSEIKKNYVLIIDEINRGNVSSIFGEIITLLETDKRLGNKESLEVRLPYSQEIFGVPNNLYIIGTMNTADRSVEALDTALRRRFSFIEIAPVEDHDSIPAEVFVDNKKHYPRRILGTINRRIEKLLSRDHKIGHSYFIGKSTPLTLKETFANNIIPLLQEYFYGDYNRMALVIGYGFLRKQENTTENFFAIKDYDALDDLLEKDVWLMEDVLAMDENKFANALDQMNY